MCIMDQIKGQHVVLDQHSFIFPAIPLFTYCLWREGEGCGKKNNPSHLDKGRIIEPFISHNTKRPYISNKRNKPNKPKRHTMTQMIFCCNPVQFHCPLFVLLLIHCLKESLLWDCIYRYKGQVKHSSTKILVWGFMSIGSCPKEAQSMLSIHGLQGTLWHLLKCLPSTSTHRAMKTVICPHFSKTSRFRLGNCQDQVYYCLPALSHYLSCIMSAVS